MAAGRLMAGPGRTGSVEGPPDGAAGEPGRVRPGRPPWPAARGHALRRPGRRAGQRAGERAEQEQAEQERRAELARSETRAILDATDEAMVMASPEGRLTVVNRRFCELFAVDAAELVGRGFAELRVLIERALTNPHALLRRLARVQGDPTAVFTTLASQHAPLRRELECSTTPVRSPPGGFLGRLYVFRDVTRQREADRMKSELVSFVSHELRTPLTTIKGYLDVILDGEVGEVPGEQRAFLEIVRRNADRLAVLVDDLLDLSRLEAGRISLTPVALDFRQLLEGAAGTLGPQIAAKGQRLELAPQDPLPAVWGEAERITQVLLNLLSNAHKYTPPGGTIAVAARVEGGLLRADVRDTGIGLSPAEQAQLFTRFYRANNRATQATGGTGLGLALARQLVELHGGRIWVESQPGEGATFSFTLPLAPRP